MSTELTKPSNNALAPAPEFLQGPAQGTEGMSGFIIPPRMIVTQPLSNAPLDKYPKGTPIIMPSELVLGTFNEAEKCLDDLFYVVPLFFFVEYTLDNPRTMRAQLGAVRERTFDPESEVALRAQNFKLREIPCPENPKEVCKYTTRLNFVLQILDEAIPDPVLVTFKSGEMKTGMQFNSLIKARRASIFGCVFAFDVGYRENDKGKWYGFDPSNPPAEVGPWVTNKDLFEQFKHAHEEYKQAHERKLLLPSLDDDSDDGMSSPEM